MRKGRAGGEEGRMYKGRMYEGRMYEGMVYKGKMYEGRMYLVSCPEVVEIDTSPAHSHSF